MRATTAISFALCGALAILAGCGDMDAEQEAIEQRVSELDYLTPPLLNGWTNYGFGTGQAAHAFQAGFSHLRGAIKNGTSPIAFILPAGERPNANVYLPVNLWNATKGRLRIEANGTVSVSAEGGAFAIAQGVTSLEGVSFAVNPISGLVPLALQNGWTGGPFGTRPAAAIKIDNVVRLVGAVANGTSSTIFTLPAGMAPSADVYLPVDLYGGSKGRIKINTAGTATVQAEGPFSNAQGFTSLEGVAFPAGTSGFNCMAPQPGWTGAPFGTRMPCAKIVGGILRMTGAVSTTGTNPVPLILPAGHRPSVNTYVSVDLCNAKQGRVLIQPSGVVTVQPKGPWIDARCFASLEGVSFGL